MSKNNTIFIGENKSFRERNRRSGGYLLKRRAGQVTISVVRALLMFGLCFMIIQPLVTRFSVSLMAAEDLYDSTIRLLPRNVTLDNYRIVAELTSMPTSMINTAWISLVMSICQVVSTTLVAYGFARYEFPLKKFWFACVVMLIIIPPQTIQTALFMSFTHFDIFGIFKYFRSVPVSLEEAAYVDGCGTIHTFVKIMLPDAVPTIASCFLFSFVWQWTDLFYTRNFISGYKIYSRELSNITSIMSKYFARNATENITVPLGRQMQLIGIGVFVCCVPLIILYAFTQKTFVQSLTMTGSKE